MRRAKHSLIAMMIRCTYDSVLAGNTGTRLQSTLFFKVRVYSAGWKAMIKANDIRKNSIHNP